MAKQLRIASLMLHTSPLEQAGIGDAGGMNVYVVESAKRIAESGIGVDIYTRANRSGLPEVVEIADGVNVRHLEAGPYGGITKDELPSQVCALMSSFMHQEARLASNYYELVHSHYWISGQLGWLISERLSIPLVNNMHTMAKVKNLALAEGEKAEPEIRAIGEEQVVKASSALIANTASMYTLIRANNAGLIVLLKPRIINLTDCYVQITNTTSLTVGESVAANLYYDLVD